MHNAARAWVRSAVGLVGPGQHVLEIGSREINGAVRDLFPGTAYVGIDLAPGPGVDQVASGADFRPAVPPDRVVCCEVLEHAADAEALVENAWRALAERGWLIVTAAAPERPEHSAVDGGPLRAGEFYRGVPAKLLSLWIAGAALNTGTVVGPVHMEHDVARGDVYALVQKVATA